VNEHLLSQIHSADILQVESEVFIDFYFRSSRPLVPLIKCKGFRRNSPCRY